MNGADRWRVTVMVAAVAGAAALAAAPPLERLAGAAAAGPDGPDPRAGQPHAPPHLAAPAEPDDVAAPTVADPLFGDAAPSGGWQALASSAALARDDAPDDARWAYDTQWVPRGGDDAQWDEITRAVVDELAWLGDPVDTPVDGDTAGAAHHAGVWRSPRGAAVAHALWRDDDGAVVESWWVFDADGAAVGGRVDAVLDDHDGRDDAAVAAWPRVADHLDRAHADGEDAAATPDPDR